MGTLAISIHWWRRPALSCDLFMWFAGCGFVTVGVSRLVLLDQLRNLKARLQKLTRD